MINRVICDIYHRDRVHIRKDELISFCLRSNKFSMLVCGKSIVVVNIRLPFSSRIYRFCHLQMPENNTGLHDTIYLSFIFINI